MMSEQALLLEFNRRFGHASSLKGDLFAAQRRCVDSRAPRKVVRCGRRAGKTHMCSIMLLDAAVQASVRFVDAPELRCVYIALTKGHAKRLLWPIIKDLNTKHELGLQLNETELIATLPNKRARIWLTGANRPEEIEKLRGGAYPLVIVDEAGSFGGSLTYTVNEVLRYALADYGGTLVLTGTPNARCAGLFYDADTGALQGYEAHNWTLADNERFPLWAGKDDWASCAQDWLAEHRKEHGIADTDATYRRELLGEWIKDESAMVYRFDTRRNTYIGDGADIIPVAERRHIIACDIGHDDECAFAVVAYGPHDDTTILVYEYSRSGMIVDDMGRMLQSLIREYKPEAVVADTGGLGKMIVAELNKRYALNIAPAQKDGKAAFIDILNSDLQRGLVKLPRGRTAEQMETVQWDTARKIEDPIFANDATDAFLYAYRESRHFIAQKKPVVYKRGTPEWEAEQERKLMEREFAPKKGHRYATRRRK